MKLNLLIITAVAIVAVYAVIAGCATHNKVKTLSAKDFQHGIESPNVQILDVRTPSEFAEGHIKGAINIDFYSTGFVSDVTKTLTKDKPVFVYCRSGRRSAQAADILKKNGFNVADLDGGILNWKCEGLPLIP